MELPQAPIKAGFTWEKIFAVALVLFILFGFATKLVVSASMDLNSDMVGEGLQAMDIWKHGNYLLGGYFLPSDDTFIFTELLPFQLIPQVLTGYDPLALKLVSFVIFVLAVIVLSYVIFLVSGEAACALLFAALAANISPEAYAYFAIPTTHIATMAFMGAMLALLLLLLKKDRELEEKAAKKRKKKAPAATKILWAYVAALAVLAAITVLSDSIILAWLIVPFIAAYLLLLRGKSPSMNVAVAVLAGVSLLAYIYKSYFVPSWMRQSILAFDQARMLSLNLPLSFKSLAIFINPGLYAALNGFQGFGIMEALSLAALAILLALALRNVVADRKTWLLCGILSLSALLMFAAFLANSLVNDITQARYFTFTGLSVFMLIAAAYRKEDKIYGAIALGLVLILAIYSLGAIDMHQPNAREYGLISFLKENNLTFGYSTYWNANLLTYLSGEDVTVRDVFIYRDGLEPDAWLGCAGWYRSPPEKAFVLIDNTTLNRDSRNAVEAMAKSLNASEPLTYGKYIVYPISARPFTSAKAPSTPSF